MQFSQGDNAILTLTAQDGNGNAINLTGATFSTQILGANGSTLPIAVFGNSQHTITNSAQGIFTLTLSATDTANCGLGTNKEVVTAITQSGNVIYFHGPNVLTVLPNVPIQ